MFENTEKTFRDLGLTLRVVSNNEKIFRDSGPTVRIFENREKILHHSGLAVHILENTGKKFPESSRTLRRFQKAEICRDSGPNALYIRECREDIS